MPPTHLLGGNVNMFHPYVVGQSGTERPESVLVTRLPARTRRTVHPATNFANRWSTVLRPALRAYRPCCLVGGGGRGLEREVRGLGFLGADLDRGRLRAGL